MTCYWIDALEDSPWVSLLGKSFIEKDSWRCYLLGKTNNYSYLRNCTGIAGIRLLRVVTNPMLCMHARMYACFGPMYMLMHDLLGPTPLLEYVWNCGNQCFSNILNLRPFETLICPWNGPWYFWYWECVVWLERKKLLCWLSCDNSLGTLCLAWDVVLEDYGPFDVLKLK